MEQSPHAKKERHLGSSAGQRERKKHPPEGRASKNRKEGEEVVI